MDETTHEQWAAALDDAVRRALDAAGVFGPPVDALAVAARLGITVAEDGRQAGRGRCVRTAAGAVILLRPDRRERRQWATAHEIGEQAAWRVFAALGVDARAAPANLRERTADAFAARLLLPTDWFGADGSACGWDLAALKARHPSASHELIARRTLDFPVPAIVTIVDGPRLRFRRGSPPGRVPPLSADERACWRRVRAENAFCQHGPVRGWPVHEPGWQREILRTDLPDGDAMDAWDE